MKKITFVFYLAFTTFLFPQYSTTQEQKLDSVQTFKWNDPILPNEWLMQSRDHYVYDNGGTEYTNWISLTKDNNTTLTWIKNLQQIRTFNAQDKIESEIFKIWNGSDWVNSSKSDYSYDGSGNNDVITYYNHNGSDWFLTGQDLNVYNGSNLVTTNTTQIWNGTEMKFDNVNQIRSTYSGDLLMEDSHYNWDSTVMPQDWNANPHFVTTLSYTGTLIKDYTTQIDNGSGLVNSSLIENTYNGNNLEITTIKIWDTDNEKWDNSSQNVSTYDMNNQILEIITYYFVFPEFWVPNFKFIPFWSDASLSANSNNAIDGKAYPNPFTNELNIKLQSVLKEDGTLKIINVQGQVISEIYLNKGVKSISIKNPRLAKGIYFIKIITPEQNETFKVIKE